MVLVAHFNLKLLQTEMKTTFLNIDIEEAIYMVQSEKFVLKGPKNIVCNLKNPSMCLNKHIDNSIFSFIKWSSLLVLR